MKQYIHQASNRIVHVVILHKYRQVAFYIRVMFLKNIAQLEKCKLNTKFPFKIVCVPRIDNLILCSV
jgi:hypothetical protein